MASTVSIKKKNRPENNREVGKSRRGCRHGSAGQNIPKRKTYSTYYEKRGMMGPVLFPSLSIDDFVPPMLHRQMGFTNPAVDMLSKLIDKKVQKVGYGEKVARHAVLQVGT
jgi:hypothetical protein